MFRGMRTREVRRETRKTFKMREQRGQMQRGWSCYACGHSLKMWKMQPWNPAVKMNFFCFVLLFKVSIFVYFCIWDVDVCAPVKA